MGNDGGSIPKRRELVREAVRAQTASEAKESQQEHHAHQWTTCALSQQPLQAPVVADGLGLLYNKDALLEYLLPDDDPAAQLAKADAAKVLGDRVHGLKDVVEVRFEVNADAGAGAGTTGRQTPAWICPVTHKQLGPAVKAAYIVPCGHAFSEIALKEVAELVCLQCNEPYAADNVVTILPTKAEDKARLQKRLDDLKAQGLSHALKKAGGKKKRKHVEANGATAESDKAAVAVANGNKAAARAANGGSGSGIKNAATASLTAKVLAEEEARAKRRKAAASETVRTLFSDKQAARKDGDFMTRGFTIPAGAKH